MSSPRRAIWLLPFLLWGGVRATCARAAPPASDPGTDRWAGFMDADPAARLAAVGRVTGPLVELADALPLLVVALDDEAAPVRAAARERILALAKECVDPLLDALGEARSGARSGAFRTLSALGTTVTPTDVAFALGGGKGAVSPVDRLEAALFLALPRFDTPAPAGAGRHVHALLDLARLAATDGNLPVQRAGAGAAALLACLLARSAGEGGGVLRSPVRTESRLPNLLAGGAWEVVTAAADLAARFGDGSAQITDRLEQALSETDRRDAAALALSTLAPGRPGLRERLEKVEPSVGVCRALLRLGAEEPVLKLLARSSQLGHRRVAITACLAERRLVAEALAALLPETEKALDDGAPEDVQAALRPWIPFPDLAAPVLPLLEELSQRKETSPAAQVLAAAFALRCAPTLAWARARLEPWVGRAPAVAAAPPPIQSGPALAAALAAALDVDAVPPDALPAALGGDPLGLMGAWTLWERPLAAHVADYVERHPDPQGPWTALLLRLLADWPRGGSSAWKPTRLSDYTGLGALLSSEREAQRVALRALGRLKGPAPEVRTQVLGVLAATDLELRHRAAQTLRRLGGS